MTFTLY